MGSDNAFVKQFEPLVTSTARRLVAQLGLRCEVQDLVGFGYTGLLEARQRYDPEKGVPFRAFAYYRIRGAMLDGVRKMAYLPRRAYARLKVAEAQDDEAEQMAEARGADVAAEPPRGLPSVRALDGALGRLAVAYTIAASVESDEPGVEHETPEMQVLRRRQAERVRSAVNNLSEREAFLIRGHYLEGRPLDELSAALGLSKSWGSRLHTKALERLRRMLKESV